MSSEAEERTDWIRALQITQSASPIDFTRMATGMWEAAFEFGFNAGADSMRGYRKEQGE